MKMTRVHGSSLVKSVGFENGVLRIRFDDAALLFFNVSERIYQLDAGRTGQAQVYVGSGGAVPNNGVTPVSPWTSPQSTISVTAPGAAAPVLLACPYLVQKTTFNLNG